MAIISIIPVLEKKRERNADILYRRLKDDPESVTTLFYLCMMHLGNHEYELAEPFARQALEKMDADNPNKQHLYLMTLNNLAMIANQKNDLGRGETSLSCRNRNQ